MMAKPLETLVYQGRHARGVRFGAEPDRDIAHAAARRSSSAESVISPFK